MKRITPGGSESFYQRLHYRSAWFGAVIDRFPALFTALAAAAYVCLAAAASSQKALWFDELFTFHISRLDTLGDIWNALARGVDNHPPLDYWLRYLFMRYFGASEFVFRLPSVIAFGAALFCLFQFVTRRSSPAYGLFAGLILLSTQAHQYAYEGRPYALLLAFGALSLLCWQLAIEGKRTAVIGLGAALAAGLYSHFYAVLLFVPLIIGELWRTFERRKLDWPIWLAFGIGLVPLVTMLPIIQSARSYGQGFWTPVDARSLVSIYSDILGVSALILLALLCWLLLRRPIEPHGVIHRQNAPGHEIAAAAGYLLLPLVCYFIAKAATGAFFYRYVLPTAIGAAALTPLAVYRIRKGTGLALPAAILCLSLSSAVTWVETYRDFAKKTTVANLIKELNQWLPRGGEPLLIADGLRFVQLTHYAAPNIQQRFVYVASSEDSLKLGGSDTIDRGILALSPLLPSPVVKYQQFVEHTPRFRMVLAKDSWHVQKLLADGASVSAIGILRGQPVYEVTFSKTAAPSFSRPTTSR